jgi:hypothetical protein
MATASSTSSWPAPYEDSGELDSGRVYVFHGGQGLVSGSADTRVRDADRHPELGPDRPVAARRRRRRRSIADLMIGAPDANALGTRDGLAYLFRGGAALTSRTVADADAVVHGDGQLLEGFSTATSLLDIDGDGFAGHRRSVAALVGPRSHPPVARRRRDDRGAQAHARRGRGAHRHAARRALRREPRARPERSTAPRKPAICRFFRPFSRSPAGCGSSARGPEGDLPSWPGSRRRCPSSRRRRRRRRRRGPC